MCRCLYSVCCPPPWFPMPKPAPLDWGCPNSIVSSIGCWGPPFCNGVDLCACPTPNPPWTPGHPLSYPPQMPGSPPPQNQHSHTLASTATHAPPPATPQHAQVDNAAPQHAQVNNTLPQQLCAPTPLASAPHPGCHLHRHLVGVLVRRMQTPQQL